VAWIPSCIISSPARDARAYRSKRPGSSSDWGRHRWDAMMRVLTFFPPCHYDSVTQARTAFARRPLEWSLMCRDPASATPMRPAGATPPRQLGARTGWRGLRPWARSNVGAVFWVVGQAGRRVGWSRPPVTSPGWPGRVDVPCSGRPAAGPAGPEPGPARTGLTMPTRARQEGLYWVGQGCNWRSQCRAEEICVRPVANW